jgi:hypothetical protein
LRQGFSSGPKYFLRQGYVVQGQKNFFEAKLYIVQGQTFFLGKAIVQGQKVFEARF